MLILDLIHIYDKCLLTIYCLINDTVYVNLNAQFTLFTNWKFLVLLSDNNQLTESTP